ncbi:MAG: hypothetical protein RL701_341 [Pseudomonadota bacterium]
MTSWSSAAQLLSVAAATVAYACSGDDQRVHLPAQSGMEADARVECCGSFDPQSAKPPLGGPAAALDAGLDASYAPLEGIPSKDAAAAPIPLDSSISGGASSEVPYFSTVSVAERSSLMVPGGFGDLWPSCWSDDGHLYAAWGDGTGFEGSGPFVDIGVARIAGNLWDGSLRGENLAIHDAVGQVWTSDKYNRKPTGMACVNGDLYLAVQDLTMHSFDDAPAATILRSHDKGRTWEWDRSAPMFADHVATTIFFLDSGQDGSSPAIVADDFVYAFALDGSWRTSYGGTVQDPMHLWLARVPKDAIQRRDQWQWYAGLTAAGAPAWERDFDKRVPVLTDARRLYTKTVKDFGAHVANLSVISQGGVVYNAPLRRYIYTSWTEYTFEFYEAPSPWGPFRLFASKDFGVFPWSDSHFGGYGATVPSKFVSEDGTSMYLQTNTWERSYTFSLREVRLERFQKKEPDNIADVPIPMASLGAVTIGSSFRTGQPQILSDGIVADQSEDSRTGERREFDVWGYEWPREYRMNRLSYSAGSSGNCGGFEALGVDVRHSGEWVPVSGISVFPRYDAGAAYRTYAIDFPTVQSGDGVRLRGKPVGESACTTIAELAIEYRSTGP